MEKLKETFLKKYGIWEYILMLVGLTFLYKVVEYLIVTSIPDMTWDEILILITLLAIGALATGRPLAILDLARKTVGIPPRKNK